ncbi:MAG TPA: thermonuclease family protein [Chthoniobacterales bacterium]|jgi:endonuclease YncB( thermonuclease family)|nr:thermonuclease family protein [Chthoniobacterales bacterium]
MKIGRLALIGIALLQLAIVDLGAHGQWTTLTNCRYQPNAANDGDSFHVVAGNKKYLFRLYFVDAPETDGSLGDRIDEQAKYFGIIPQHTIQVGKLATEFTKEKLSGNFTVRTCFQDALGRSKMERFYAIVQTPSGDLAEQLIENGLARIHGASANAIGLPPGKTEWRKLERLEKTAKAERVGGWGVNYGRMLVRSETAKTRAPVDPFEDFFHPERAAQKVAAASSAPNDSKKSDSFDGFFIQPLRRPVRPLQDRHLSACASRSTFHRSLT